MLTRSTRILCIAVLAAAFLVQPLGRQATLSAATLVGPKPYYLALGDSVTYGAQPNGDNSHGFADDLFQYLQARGTTTLVNMACRHETTTTFMKGGCPELAGVKYPYGSSSSQLAAALAFIQAHPGQVSPVTLEIGAADVDPDINPTANPCTINTIKSLFDGGGAITNLNSILSQLKAALNGSGDLVLLDYFDPYQNQCPNLVQNAQTLNTNIKQAAQTNGATFVDVYAAFGGGATPNPNLCNYTWTYTCNTPPDIDANTQGYAVIAQAIESTLSYPAVASTPTTGAGTPVATTGPVTATATTAPATATRTLATSTPVRYSTPAPTPTPALVVLAPVATATPAPCRIRLPLAADLRMHQVESGKTLSFGVRTSAHARVTIDLTVSKTVTTFQGSGTTRKKIVHTTTLYRLTYHGTTDASGRVTARMRVTYRLSKAQAAQIKVSASSGCKTVALIARLSIVPPRAHA